MEKALPIQQNLEAPPPRSYVNARLAEQPTYKISTQKAERQDSQIKLATLTSLTHTLLLQLKDTATINKVRKQLKSPHMYSTAHIHKPIKTHPNIYIHTHKNKISE